MTVNLEECALAAAAAPDGCDWCGRYLTGRRSRWCSDRCNRQYRVNHVWKFARAKALKRSGGRCVACGITTALEVNHRTPLAGLPRSESCAHHQSNLEVLCHDCHVTVTNEQRAAGWFRSPGVS